MDINIDDYKLLNLNKDPFSTAPDPEFLYQSRQHFGTLQLLECSIKEEKGMNVVLGVSGTGKTTICRQLYRKISFEKNVNAQVLYARYYESSDHLIREIAEIFGFVDMSSDDDIFDIFVRNYQKSRKTIALIVDNGHMIPEFCLSVFNRLSDLKSNGNNFFQIVIFANKEFSTNIEANPDFKSRVAHYRILGPFNFRDTRQMIVYRLKMAGNNFSITQASTTKKIFSFSAMLAIYLATGGYPRKIVVLCHRCIVAMLLKKSIKAGWFLVRSNAKRVLKSRNILSESALATSIIIIPLIIAAITIGFMNNTDFTSYIKAVNHVVEKLSVNNNTADVEPINSVSNQAEIVDDGENLIFPESLVTENSNGKNEKIELAGKENLATEKISNENTDKNGVAAEQKQIAEIEKKVDLMTLVPDIIGVVEVKRADTLLVLLESVYGHSRKKYKTPVIEANQHILNINSLEIGDKINFPTIVSNVRSGDKEVFWVKIKSAESLNDAVNFKRRWRVKSLKLKIIPYFSAGTGLHFDIVFKKLYQNKKEAETFINKVSPSIKEAPSIIVFPFKEVVFFADPYKM